MKKTKQVLNTKVIKSNKMNKTENQLSKRSFIKTALRGNALLLGIHMIDSIGFFIGVKRSLIEEAHAQGTCSTFMNCSGGSGKCSTAMDCSGSVIITNVRLGCRQSFAGNVHEPSIIENYRNSPMLEKCKHLTVDNIICEYAQIKKPKKNCITL
jgi:hypothetical protein